jgi:hypothetical protein
MPRLPTLFLHHANIRHHHATVNGFAHVVNDEKSTCGVRKIKGFSFIKLVENTLQKGLVL